MQIPGSAPDTELVHGTQGSASHTETLAGVRTTLNAFLATGVLAGRGSRFQPGPDSPLGKPWTLCGLCVLIYKMKVLFQTVSMLCLCHTIWGRGPWLRRSDSHTQPPSLLSVTRQRC